MMTPGTYLKLRRQAARLSIEDVAAMVHTAPRLGEIDRCGWIARLESDVAALSPDVIAALSDAFRFSRRVLLQLIDARSYGDGIDQPQICIICGCSNQDPCVDERDNSCCDWSTADSCTACAPSPTASLTPSANKEA